MVAYANRCLSFAFTHLRPSALPGRTARSQLFAAEDPVIEQRQQQQGEYCRTEQATYDDGCQRPLDFSPGGGGYSHGNKAKAGNQ